MPTYVSDPPGTGYTPPDPPPDPEPGDRPTPTHEYTGTATIAALQTYLDGVPDGAIVGLVASTTFTGGASQELHLSGRAISIIGRDSTLHRTARGTTRIVLLDGGNPDEFAWYDLNILGSKPSDGGLWDVTYEHEMGIQMGGIQGATFDNISIHNIGGDAWNIQGGAGRWSDGITIIGGDASECGRMWLCPYDGAQDVNVSGVAVTKIGYHCIDYEPNTATTVTPSPGGLRNLRVTGCTFTGRVYGDHVADPTQAAGYWFVATHASGDAPLSGVYLGDNTMEWPMKVLVTSGLSDVQDIQIVDNVASDDFVDDADFDECIKLESVVGLRVTGNTQPLSGAATFLTLSGCSGSIVTSPNTTP